MKKSLLIFVGLLILSCNKEVKTPTTNIPEEKPKLEFTVKLSYKTNVEDQFTFSMRNIEIDEFQKKTIQIVEKVSVYTEMEEIVANFGENNFSKNFTINFGNKEKKKIELESIYLVYGGNELLVKLQDLNKYFRLNKYLTLDESSQILQTERVDNRHIPAIVLRQNAINILKKGIE